MLLKICCCFKFLDHVWWGFAFQNSNGEEHILVTFSVTVVFIGDVSKAFFLSS